MKANKNKKQKVKEESQSKKKDIVPQKTKEQIEKEKKEQLDKVSVLIRHELLHFLLTHERRFVNYLKAKYPHS